MCVCVCVCVYVIVCVCVCVCVSLRCPLVSAALLVAFAWQAWGLVHCKGVGCTPWRPSGVPPVSLRFPLVSAALPVAFLRGRGSDVRPGVPPHHSHTHTSQWRQNLGNVGWSLIYQFKWFCFKHESEKFLVRLGFKNNGFPIESSSRRTSYGARSVHQVPRLPFKRHRQSGGDQG